MPRPRTPRAVAELTGRTRHDPQRYRAAEPETAELGAAPGHLSPQALAVWQEVTAMAPAGVIRASDAVSLEVLCSLVAEYRASPSEFKTSRIASMLTLLGRFGLSPSDRQKLGVETPRKPENEFDAF